MTNLPLTTEFRIAALKAKLWIGLVIMIGLLVFLRLNG